MTAPDRYAGFVSSGLGGLLARRLGLPRPTELRRWEPGQSLLTGPVALAGEGPAAEQLRGFAAAGRLQLTGTGPDGTGPDGTGPDGTGPESTAPDGPGSDGPGSVGTDPESTAPGGDTRAGEQELGAVVVDATALVSVQELDGVRAALAGVRRLAPSGRVVIVGLAPGSVAGPVARATQHALTGLTRSLAKELRHGATANLLQLTGPDAHLAGPLLFLLSSRSAFVSGQVLQVGAGAGDGTVLPDGALPLAGRTAVVTGAARGIGAETARTLAREGARMIVVDVPQAGQHLAEVANEVHGTALQLDITRPEAGARIAAACEPHGGLDVLVHNAGITRDRLLVNLDASRWAAVLEVNLAAQLRMDEVLLAEDGPLRADGRVIAMSSIGGIAGNRGQTNYAASKAGVIGSVQARAEALAGRGHTYNAVAPGFIETDMTTTMPVMVREVGRRINSLAQGGLPVDVAEAVTFLARPDSGGVTGQVLRVCGQSMMGA